MNMGAGLCLTSSRTLHQTAASSDAYTFLYSSAWFGENCPRLLYDAFLRERRAKSNIYTYNIQVTDFRGLEDSEDVFFTPESKKRSFMALHSDP